MIALLNRKKQHESKVYWTDCSIPAMLFFDILNTGDCSKMGTAPMPELEKAFEGIFDKYVELDGNEKVMQWYRKRLKIAFLNHQINFIESTLYTMCYTPMTSGQRLKIIDALNNIETPKIKFNTDKPILDEITRVQKVVIGSLKNRLNLELSTEKKQEKAADYSYRKDLATVENVLGHNLPEDMSLEMFIFRKKSAIEKSNAQRKLQKNGRK